MFQVSCLVLLTHTTRRLLSGAQRDSINAIERGERTARPQLARSISLLRTKAFDTNVRTASSHRDAAQTVLQYLVVGAWVPWESWASSMGATRPRGGRQDTKPCARGSRGVRLEARDPRPRIATDEGSDHRFPLRPSQSEWVPSSNDHRHEANQTQI